MLAWTSILRMGRLGVHIVWCWRLVGSGVRVYTEMTWYGWLMRPVGTWVSALSICTPKHGCNFELQGPVFLEISAVHGTFVLNFEVV